MSLEESLNAIAFHVATTDNPRPDAPRYTIRTIAELMEVVNTENVERFLSDFSHMLRFSVVTREVMQLIADDVKKDAFKAAMSEFTWIDDHPNNPDATPTE